MESRGPISIARWQPRHKRRAKYSATEFVRAQIFPHRKRYSQKMDSLESLFSLRGHRGLVTGASSGLGVECAKALALAGADVVLVARREDRVKQMAAELAKTHRVKAIGIGADVTRDDDLNRVMTESAAALGDIDI